MNVCNNALRYKIYLKCTYILKRKMPKNVKNDFF